MKRGRSAELSISGANGPLLAGIIRDVTAQMTVADLTNLRALLRTQAEPVIAA